MHSTDDLDDGYVGSGKRLWHSIRKHGLENHKCEILEFLYSREKLKIREREIVNEEILRDSQCMNLTLGGGCGWDYTNSVLTDEQRTKAGKAGGYANFTFEQRSKFSKEACQGGKAFQRLWNENHDLMEQYRKNSIAKAALTENVEKRKKTFSSIQHQKGEKNSQYGSRWMNKDGVLKKVSSLEVDNHLAIGWKFGRK
jgi:hypothetical protein